MRNQDTESERLTLLAIVFKLSVQCIPPLACISLHLSINEMLYIGNMNIFMIHWITTFSYIISIGRCVEVI